MKKIILAFGGTHFSEGAFEFARKLAGMQTILLTGVFLPPQSLATLWGYADAVNGPALMPVYEQSGYEESQTQKNIDRFEQLCQNNHIDYRVHRDAFDFAIPELKKESIYADLILLGSEVFYNSKGGDTPNDYLSEALRQMNCPVLLVPEHFTFPDNLILSYDGSSNSVYAIKQFAYLFPELAGLPAMLVYAHSGGDNDLPDQVLVEELVARHFSDLSMYRLDADPKKFFSTWLMEQKASLLVSGAYGRSGISQLFRKSFIRNVIANHKVPVFIAHR